MRPTVFTILAEAATLELAALPRRREPSEILMCSPEHFEVKDVKNAFMAGNEGQVDHARALAEWEALKATFERLGHTVHVIPGAAGCEDMVFSANQVLPGEDEAGRLFVVLSQMRHESRRREVPLFERWFAERGYGILRLDDPTLLFEGQGDAIWHPGRRLLWGGYGHRTSLATYRELATKIGAPVIALELPSPDFYHLDTCFCALDEESVLIYRDALTEEGVGLVRKYFSQVIETPKEEAYGAFACNATALPGKKVVIQRGATETRRRLEAAGFAVHEVETGEFIKSGGSVFCMKIMVY